MISAGPDEGAVVRERLQGALDEFHQLEQELEEDALVTVQEEFALSGLPRKRQMDTGQMGMPREGWKTKRDAAFACPAIITCSLLRAAGTPFPLLMGKGKGEP